jgi:hypothetical protein
VQRIPNEKESDRIASEPPWWFQSFTFAQKIPKFFIALNIFKSPKTLIKVERTNKIFDVCLSVRLSVRPSVRPLSHYFMYHHNLGTERPISEIQKPICFF